MSKGKTRRARRLSPPSFRPEHPLAVISTEAYLQPSFRPKRSEWRNPAGDGHRPGAETSGVDGTPTRFLHSAPAGGRGSGRNDGMGSRTGLGTSPASSAAPAFQNISFFSIIFLEATDPAPHIHPVNARSAPAAAGRRPLKEKQTKKPAGAFPLSGPLSGPLFGPLPGPPPPIGHPICHPVRHRA